MNANARQAQEVAAAYTRGRQAGRGVSETELRAERNCSYEAGHLAARERGRVLIIIASLVSFGAGAWFF